MPVKFWQMIFRLWFLFSYLITTVLWRENWDWCHFQRTIFRFFFEKFRQTDVGKKDKEDKKGNVSKQLSINLSKKQKEIFPNLWLVWKSRGSAQAQKWKPMKTWKASELSIPRQKSRENAAGIQTSKERFTPRPLKSESWRDSLNLWGTLWRLASVNI